MCCVLTCVDAAVTEADRLPAAGPTDARAAAASLAVVALFFFPSMYGRVFSEKCAVPSVHSVMHRYIHTQVSLLTHLQASK